MAIGISGAIIYFNITGQYKTPEITELFTQFNYHSKLSVFPFLFISIACGAISGFHATQSPIIARCITKETDGRKVFYLAMIGEGIVALIWATASMTLFPEGGVFGLKSQLAGLAAAGSAPVIVNKIALTTLGSFGAVLAVLGVVAAPITSGDTAFRGARLTIADMLKIDQKPIKNRYMLALPLFAIGAILSQVNFSIIWRYFAWCNQTLATIGLWSASVWLAKRNKNFLVTLIPAVFMTLITSCYIVMAPEGFGFLFNGNTTNAMITALIIAAVIEAIFLTLFFRLKGKYAKEAHTDR